MKTIVEPLPPPDPDPPRVRIILEMTKGDLHDLNKALYTVGNNYNGTIKSLSATVNRELDKL